MLFARSLVRLIFGILLLQEIEPVRKLQVHETSGQAALLLYFLALHRLSSGDLLFLLFRLPSWLARAFRVEILVRQAEVVRLEDVLIQAVLASVNAVAVRPEKRRIWRLIRGCHLCFVIDGLLMTDRHKVDVFKRVGLGCDLFELALDGLVIKTTVVLFVQVGGIDLVQILQLKRSRLELLLWADPELLVQALRQLRRVKVLPSVVGR